MPNPPFGKKVHGEPSSCCSYQFPGTVVSLSGSLSSETLRTVPGACTIFFGEGAAARHEADAGVAGMNAGSDKKEVNVSITGNKIVSGVLGDELFDIEAAVLLTGMVNLESLRTPDMEQAAYNSLTEAVDAGIAANESVQEFKKRVTLLGEDVVRVAKIALQDIW